MSACAHVLMSGLAVLSYANVDVPDLVSCECGEASLRWLILLTVWDETLG